MTDEQEVDVTGTLDDPEVEFGDSAEVKALNELVMENMLRMKELHVQMHPMDVSVKFEALLRFVMTPVERVAYETLVAEMISEGLDTAEAEMSRSKLLDGVPGVMPPPVQAVPGSRQARREQARQLSKASMKAQSRWGTEQ